MQAFLSRIASFFFDKIVLDATKMDLSGGGLFWKAKAETAALLRPVFGPKPAVVQVHNPFGNGQA